MHCPYCAQELNGERRRCPRCRARITPEARRHVVVVSVVYALVAILVVAMISYVVLYWHTTQLPVVPHNP